MTTRLHAGNTLAAFFRSSTGVVESTQANSYDSSYVAGSILLPIGAYIQSPTFASQTTVWAHGEFYSTDNFLSSNRLWIELVNGSGVVVARVIGASSSVLRFDNWNGATYTASSTFAKQTWTTRMRVDLKVVCGASGSWNLYINGTSLASGSISSSSTDNVVAARFYSISDGNGYWSQIMIADFDTRDCRYAMLALNGNSASNTGAASGVYTDVNESVLDESTAISITASGNKAGQTHASLTVPAGYVIGAAVINARGRVTGSITDGKLGIRSGGTNTSSAGRSYNGGYEPRNSIVENDPNTSTRFTQTGFNNAEIYLEAA